jgi:hypothetical protein
MLHIINIVTVAATFHTQALQDEGVPDPKSEHNGFKFPQLQKMSTKIYEILKEKKLDRLPANKTRGSESVQKCLLSLRKHIDKTEVYNELSKHGKYNSPQVFILQNDLVYFGFDYFLTLYFSYLGSVGNKKEEQRTPSDAIRVAGVLLLPEFRGTVQGLLGGTRNREQQDQSVSPTIAFSMDAVKKFNDVDFIVPKPATMDEDDIKNCDPNDIARIDLERSAEWFLSTWKTYIKPKYKLAISRWDKLTGGGCSEPHQFSNFCGNNKWLVWIYLLDMDADFLLFSNAKGKPPSFVGNEAGFGTPNTDDDDSSPIPNISKRKREAEEAVQQTKEAQKKVCTMLDRVGNLMQALEQRNPNSTSSIARGETPETIIQQLIQVNEQKQKLRNIPLSPASKAAVKDTLQAKIERLGTQLKELTSTAAAAPSEESDDSSDDE